MSSDELNFYRAKRALQAYCAQRNASAGDSAARLECRQQGGSLILLERPCGVSAMSSRPVTCRPLLRFDFLAKSWRVYWSDAKGGWKVYRSLPETPDMEQLLQELDRAPLHIHW